MAFTKYQIFLTLLLVVTGSINSLTTKWADKLESAGSDGKVRLFQHPFVQAFVMFMGEFVCLMIYRLTVLYNKYKQRNREELSGLVATQGSQFNQFVLYLPALCDMLSTSTMYMGLCLTYVSSFQMLRGSVIVFVGLLSVGFLDRRFGRREWSGMFFTVMGLVIVGASDVVYQSDDSAFDQNAILTGDLLIILAQIITAIQMVLEEKFITGLDINPLQAVGWEGFFGSVTLGVLLSLFYFIPAGPPFANNAHGVLEDFPDAWAQIMNNRYIAIAIIGTFVSIAFFNFAGISVTKEISATTRMVLDSIRAIVIWIVSLKLEWQEFHWPQLVGFIILIFGNCLYNNIFSTIYKRFNRYERIVEDRVVVNQAAEDVETP